MPLIQGSNRSRFDGGRKHSNSLRGIALSSSVPPIAHGIMDQNLQGVCHAGTRHSRQGLRFQNTDR
jgi:hypothetical protein